jgi:hypothetical protein
MDDEPGPPILAAGAVNQPEARRLVPDPAYDHLLVAAQLHAGIWVPRQVNGSELPDWEAGPPLPQCLELLGADGWDAQNVNVVNATMFILLKRPRSRPGRTKPVLPRRTGPRLGRWPEAP